MKIKYDIFLPSTLKHICDSGLPRVWPRQGFHPGLDASDRGSKPCRHMGHLWVLGLVPLFLTTPGQDSLNLQDFKTLPGKAGKIQDEPPVPLFQPDQARRPGEKPTIHGP